MWAEKSHRAIKFFTARPNGVLRGGQSNLSNSGPNVLQFTMYRTARPSGIYCASQLELLTNTFF